MNGIQHKTSWDYVWQLAIAMLVIVLALAAVVYIVVSLMLILARPASAQTCADYDWNYNLTNFYSSYTLIYDFTNLCTTRQYIFRVESYDLVTGASLAQYTVWFGGDGSTSAERSFNEWPSNTYTAIRVRDDFGQILGKHYLAPVPDSDNSWTTGETHASPVLKQSIGNLPQESDNATGILHESTRQDLVTTRLGDFILLHYRADHTASPIDETIRISQIAAVSTIDIDIATMAALNTHPDFDWTVIDPLYPDGVQNFYNFVLLSTGSNLLQFPFSLQMDSSDIGVYEYARLDSLGDEIANGESLWLVVNHSQSEFDCSLTRASVVQEKTQIAKVTNRSEPVFESLQTQRLSDTIIGNVGEDVLSLIWNPTRNVVYTITTALTGTATVTYIVVSDETSAFLFDTMLTDYPFNIPCGAYLIRAQGERATIWEHIERVKPDSTVTILAGLLGITGLLSFAAFVLGISRVIPFLFVALIAAGMFLDLFPLWLDVLLAVFSIIILIYGVRRETTN